MMESRKCVALAASLGLCAVAPAQNFPHVNFYWTTPGGQTTLWSGESIVLSLWAAWDDPDWPVFAEGQFNIALSGWHASDAFATHRDWTFGTEDDGGTGFLGRRPDLPEPQGNDTLRFIPDPGDQGYVLLDLGGGSARIEGRWSSGGYSGEHIELVAPMDDHILVPETNPIEVFRLGFIAGDGPRSINIETDFTGAALRWAMWDWYLHFTPATFTDASITLRIIPAPAGLGVLALAGLFAAQRRRAVVCA